VIDFVAHPGGRRVLYRSDRDDAVDLFLSILGGNTQPAASPTRSRSVTAGF
jgi:hypothetical protein